MKRNLQVRVLAGFPLVLAMAVTAFGQSTTVTQPSGGNSGTTTVTGPNGKTGTSSNNESWGNGSYTDNHTVTGPNGKTASSTMSKTGNGIKNNHNAPNSKSGRFSASGVLPGRR